MVSVRGRQNEDLGRMPLAFTDTHLCYWPKCAHRFGYDDPRKWGPSWLPFISILETDDLPEKYCDACAAPLA
jgi:hypothetical protein